MVISASAKPAKLDTKTILAEMEQSKFGSSIMSFLHLNSLGDVPTDELTSVLDDLLDQLQTRQADADGFNNTNQALCDETLSNLENQINTETSTISSLENTIEVEGENLDAAKRELNQAAGDLDETEESLESGTAQREAEHTKWVDNDYQHNEAIVAIEETVKLIKHMIHGVTFAQIKPRYEKVQETLKSST
jgi:chromosome segregation ATPase